MDSVPAGNTTHSLRTTRRAASKAAPSVAPGRILPRHSFVFASDRLRSLVSSICCEVTLMRPTVRRMVKSGVRSADASSELRQRAARILTLPITIIVFGATVGIGAATAETLPRFGTATFGSAVFGGSEALDGTPGLPIWLLYYLNVSNASSCAPLSAV
jgi:hypothetical protein